MELTAEQQAALGDLRVQRGEIRQFQSELRFVVRRAAALGVPWHLIAAEVGLRVREVLLMVNSEDPDGELARAGVALADPERPLRLALLRLDDYSRVSGTGVVATGHLDPVTGYASLSWRGGRSRFVNLPVGEWQRPTAENSVAVEWLEDIHSREGTSRLLVLDEPLDDTARALAHLLGANSAGAAVEDGQHGGQPGQ
jgi:hypothetical protein